ncbi:bifunctional DNA primase/polymerase [Cupriavidus sp. DL-D2]|uniref:bifunctional DNA primase/polymerase n=1 Tax=Cupriavidus sp. DL-D2 TaxID=3144974 RepID=UPI0032137DD0
MSKNIFADNAPRHYAAGLPVIPLYARAKRPIPNDWSRYYDHPVEDAQQKQWLEQIPDANMGLVLGPQSGVVAMDIDTEDEGLMQAIISLLPVSPWRRIGKKGMVLAFKYSGLKTFRIKNTSGETICEMLSARTQVVLPPSIHPDTGLPYTANCELVDVLHQLPTLDDQIETILRSAIEARGVQLSHSGWSRVTDHVSAGSRDTSMTEKAGLFAYAVMRGERTLKEAIGMLQSYHAEFVEKVAGDEVDVAKHVENLVKFLHRDVMDKGKVLPEGWDADLTDEERKNLNLEFSSDHEEWSFVALRDFLKGEFERYPEGSSGREAAVDKILHKLAHSTNINKLEEDRLLEFMQIASGMGVKVSSLRARLKELRQGELKGLDHTEIARAVIADIEVLYPIRYHNNFLWRWAGSHWDKLDENFVMAKISSGYGHLQACKKHSDMKGILNVIKILLPQGIRALDVAGINFANGFLSDDLKLLPHDMAYGMTYTLPFRYLPDIAGKCDMFLDFLNKSWGHNEDFTQKVEALQEALCVTLFGLGPRFQRAVLLQGAPKSGKSQLLKIASSLVPDDARASVPPNDWNDKFLPTQMHEKLINVAGELSEKKLVDGQKFKDIIDGTEMNGQLKGGQIFRFRPMCTHWFASNHYPRTEDTSEGFNRRWLVLQFDKPVRPEDRKLDFGDLIVAEEREAIVAWAVLSMERLKARRDYTLPSSHRQIIREVASLNNSVRFFLQESGKVRTGAALQASGGKPSTPTSETVLYNAYWSFCIGAGGAKPVGSTLFRSKMRELGPELGFNLLIRNLANGGQEAVYENLILAERVVG